jgi:hypothetical protein
MQRVILSLCLVLAGAIVQGQGVYKVIQPDGSVEFTDSPPPGESAQPVQVQPLNSMPSPGSPRDAFDDSSAAKPAYSEVRITSPESGTSFWDTSGNVKVDVSLKPSLQPGDKLEVLLDGQAVGGGRSTAITLTNMNRGTHSVQAVVKNSSGKVLARSNAVSFTLQKGSLLSPQRRPVPTPHGGG